MVDLFETHDRARFETNLISFGHDDESPMRRRVERAADRFLDLAGEPDETIAARIQDAKIDIVIDLDGHTRSNRLAVLARRPAPVQVTFLGYPGTLGTDFIDYIIADEFVLPPDQHQNFSEKVVYLPDTYQPCDRQRTFAPTPTRRECGLPEQGFVFCCFNNSYKITPDVFDIWARILNAVPGSVLWLLAQSDLAAENLRREAQARGVDPNRLVFGSGLGTAEHLARHRLADLVLDTMPYNAHTTANDALFAGLPVLTRVGKAFPARVAGSLLRAVDMPELITESAEEYEHLAIAIARDPARHVALRDRLRRNIATSPLFDTERFARKIEAAYLQMADISRRGEEPRSFAVD